MVPYSHSQPLGKKCGAWFQVRRHSDSATDVGSVKVKGPTELCRVERAMGLVPYVRDSFVHHRQINNTPRRRSDLLR